MRNVPLGSALSLSLVFVYASLVGFGLILYSKYVKMSLRKNLEFCVLAEKKLDESSLRLV